MQQSEPKKFAPATAPQKRTQCANFQFVLHISEAAKTLFVSQPSLTGAVRDLEDNHTNMCYSEFEDIIPFASPA